MERQGSGSGLRWLQLQQLAVFFVGDQVQVAVGGHAHVADALAQVLEQSLLGHDAVALELQPDQVALRQRAQEQAVVPGLARLAGVERHPRQPGETSNTKWGGSMPSFSLPTASGIGWPE